MTSSCVLLKCLKSSYDKQLNDPPPLPVKLARELHKDVLLLCASEITEQDYEPLARFLNDARVIRCLEVILICRTVEQSASDQAKMTVKQLRHLEAANNIAHRLCYHSSRLMKALMVCIRQSKRLHTIVLDGINTMEVEFVDMLGQAIHDSPSELRWFQLCSCSLGDVGVSKLLPYLNDSPLQVLILERCGITDKGFVVVWRFIQRQEEAMDSKFWNATLRIEPPSALNTGMMGYHNLLIAGQPRSGSQYSSPQSPLESTRRSVGGSHITNTLWNHWVENQKDHKQSTVSTPSGGDPSSTSLSTSFTTAPHSGSPNNTTSAATASIHTETDIVCTSGLVALSISGNHITSAGLDSFLQNLSSNHWLLGVNLANNNLEEAVFPKMVESLSANNVLYALVLGGNESFTIGMAEQLLDVMPISTEVQGTDICDTHCATSSSVDALIPATSANVQRCQLLPVEVQDLLRRWRSLQTMEGTITGTGHTAGAEGQWYKGPPGQHLGPQDNQIDEAFHQTDKLCRRYPISYATESMPALSAPEHFEGDGKKETVGYMGNKRTVGMQAVERNVSPTGVRVKAAASIGTVPLNKSDGTATSPMKRPTSSPTIIIPSSNSTLLIGSPHSHSSNRCHSRASSSGVYSPVPSSTNRDATAVRITPHHAHEIPMYSTSTASGGKLQHASPIESSLLGHGRNRRSSSVNEGRRCSDPGYRRSQDLHSPRKGVLNNGDSHNSRSPRHSGKDHHHHHSGSGPFVGVGSNSNRKASGGADAPFRYRSLGNDEHGRNRSSTPQGVTHTHTQVKQRIRHGRVDSSRRLPKHRSRCASADHAMKRLDHRQEPSHTHHSLHVIGRHSVGDSDIPLTRVRARALRVRQGTGLSLERDLRASFIPAAEDCTSGIGGRKLRTHTSKKKKVGNHSKYMSVDYEEVGHTSGSKDKTRDRDLTRHRSMCGRVSDVSPSTLSDTSQDAVYVSAKDVSRRSHSNAGDRDRRTSTSVPRSQPSAMPAVVTNTPSTDKMPLDQLQEKLACAMHSITKDFEHFSIQLQEATVAFANPSNPLFPPAAPMDSST